MQVRELTPPPPFHSAHLTEVTMFDIDISRLKGNRFLELIWAFPCPQKILMVTDGSLDFGTGGFGLSEFVSIIQSAGHTISTAHRSGVGPVTIAGNFTFSSNVNTNNFDQIWLFGFSTAALADSEKNRIAQFMQSGGGVFATGDHSTIGAGMGANIPRVRLMRNWSSIPMATPERLDTVLEPGPDNLKQFQDQSDAIPQRIYPVFFSNGGSDFAASTWSVHPILRHPSGAVDYLPDHPHESECIAPTPVAGTFAGVEEWPSPTGGGGRIAPQVAAVSISAGRFINSGAPTPTGTKPPVKPRCFGAISVYDGDMANVGRIVCDATWHHFVNINLNGSGAGLDPTTMTPRRGLYSGIPLTPTPEYEKIKTYFRNTARWLAPRNRRSCWPFVVLSTIRFDFEMLELRLPEPHPCPWDILVRIGSVAEDTANRLFGPGTMEEMVDEMLFSSRSAASLAKHLRAFRKELNGEVFRESERSLLPVQNIRRVIFASVINVIASKLPDDPKKAERLLKKGHDKLATEVIDEGIRGAEQAIDVFLEDALKQTAAMAKAFRSRK